MQELIIIIKLLVTAFVTHHVLKVRKKRYKIREKHAKLNEEDLLSSWPLVVSILQTIQLYEFPFLVKTGIEIALLKTFSIPSISFILDKTGEFCQRPGKRIDDTDLLARAFYENGPDSIKGIQAIERMNQIHNHYKIRNIDHVFTICLFVVHTIEMINKYGYRRLLPIEEEAIFLFWVGFSNNNRSIGHRMNIENLPKSLNEMYDFVDDYQLKYMKFAKSNIRVANATRDQMLNALYPKVMHGLIKQIFYVVIEDNVLDAFHYPKSSRVFECLVICMVFIYNGFMKYLCLPRERPWIRIPKSEDLNVNDVHFPLYHEYSYTYKKCGFKIKELGPEYIK